MGSASHSKESGWPFSEQFQGKCGLGNTEGILRFYVGFELYLRIDGFDKVGNLGLIGIASGFWQHSGTLTLNSE